MDKMYGRNPKSVGGKKEAVEKGLIESPKANRRGSKPVKTEMNRKKQEPIGRRK